MRYKHGSIHIFYRKTTIPGGQGQLLPVECCHPLFWTKGKPNKFFLNNCRRNLEYGFGWCTVSGRVLRRQTGSKTKGPAFDRAFI